MLLSIIGAAAIITTLTAIFAFFSYISDQNKNAEEQKEKGKEGPTTSKPSKTRQVENMQGVPLSPHHSKNNLKSVSQPASVTHKKNNKHR